MQEFLVGRWRRIRRTGKICKATPTLTKSVTLNRGSLDAQSMEARLQINFGGVQLHLTPTVAIPSYFS